MNNPNTTYTLEDFISLKNTDSVTYHNLAILGRNIELDNNIVIQLSTNNVLYDYMDELKIAAKTIEMNNNDFVKFQYRPKQLAYELYGTTETYFILLALNGMCSVKEFNKKIIKALSPSDMNLLLSYIYNAEINYIEKNRRSFEK